MLFGLDDQVLRFPAISAPRLAPAIPPPTMMMSKSIIPAAARLPIGKPRLLGLAMFNGAFTQLLVIGLAAILVVAAVIDVRTFTISNRLNLAVALLAPLYWLSIALAPWPGMAIQSQRGRRICAHGRRLLCRDDGRRRRQAGRGPRPLVSAGRQQSSSLS